MTPKSSVSAAWNSAFRPKDPKLDSKDSKVEPQESKFYPFGLMTVNFGLRLKVKHLQQKMRNVWSNRPEIKPKVSLTGTNPDITSNRDSCRSEV